MKQAGGTVAVAEHSPIQQVAQLAKLLTRGGAGLGETVALVAREAMAALGASGVHAGVISFGYLHLVLAEGTSAGIVERVDGFVLDEVQLPACRAVASMQAIWEPSVAHLVPTGAGHGASMPDTGSMAAVPLLVGGRAVGVVVLEFESPRDFARADREHLEAVIHLGALAIGGWCSTPPRTRTDAMPAPFGVDLLLSLDGQEGLIALDKHLLITGVNARLCGLFGYSADQLAGMPVELLVPEAQRRQHMADGRDYLAHPQPRSMGGRGGALGRRADGTELAVSVTLLPCRGPRTVEVLAVVRPRPV